MTTQTYSMSATGGPVRRIRTPHPNDVLSGRGGGINAHEGNKRFREQVALRKEEYNLAPNKAEKTRIAVEVMETIVHQDPPGRFLQRDESMPTGPTWWVEVGDARALAKTSQALREGAPQIRLAHQDELHQRAAEMSKVATKRKAKRSSSVAKPVGTAETSRNTKIRPSDPAVLGAANSSFVRNEARLEVPSVSVSPALKVVSRRLPAETYNRAMEQLEENAREAQYLAYEEEQVQQQQKQQQQYPPVGGMIIAPLTSNKVFAERYLSPPSKRIRSDLDQFSAPTSMTGGGLRTAYHSSVAGTEHVDVMADTPPLVPAPAPINAVVGMTPFNLRSSSTTNGLKRYGNGGLRISGSGRGLTRAHSLAFSDVSSAAGVNDEYDDEFVNPFADESDVASKVLLPLDSRGDVQSTAPASAPDTPGAMLRNLSNNESVNGGNIADTSFPFLGNNWATPSR